MQRIDLVVELYVIRHTILRLGQLAHLFTVSERLQLGEQLRDCADAVDHGHGNTLRGGDGLPLALAAQARPPASSDLGSAGATTEIVRVQPATPRSRIANKPAKGRP